MTLEFENFLSGGWVNIKVGESRPLDFLWDKAYVNPDKPDKWNPGKTKSVAVFVVTDVQDEEGTELKFETTRKQGRKIWATHEKYPGHTLFLVTHVGTGTASTFDLIPLGLEESDKDKAKPEEEATTP